MAGAGPRRLTAITAAIAAGATFPEPGYLKGSLLSVGRRQRHRRSSTLGRVPQISRGTCAGAPILRFRYIARATDRYRCESGGLRIVVETSAASKEGPYGIAIHHQHRPR